MKANWPSVSSSSVLPRWRADRARRALDRLPPAPPGGEAANEGLPVRRPGQALDGHLAELLAQEGPLAVEVLLELRGGRLQVPPLVRGERLADRAAHEALDAPAHGGDVGVRAPDVEAVVRDERPLVVAAQGLLVDRLAVPADVRQHRQRELHGAPGRLGVPGVVRVKRLGAVEGGRARAADLHYGKTSVTK